jgi:hypothetical protein
MEVADLWKESTPDTYGLRSVLDGGHLYCGTVIEAFAINGVRYQWPRAIRKLLWSFNFSKLGKLSDMDCKDAATEWFKGFSDCCDRLFEYTPDPTKANILYTKTTLDGRSGVLADMQIPVGNLTPASQLIGRFDDSEAWGLGEDLPLGQIDFFGTGYHETGHALGSGHEPASIKLPSLMAPIYDPRIRVLQEIDKQEMVRRYGAPVSPPPVPTGPPPGAKGVNFRETKEIEQDGKIWRGEVSGTLQRVK